jgi:uncharacterized protein with GYD domain
MASGKPQSFNCLNCNDDIVTVVEAPDEISATALNLSIGALGNVRTESLRAFSAAEMMTIVDKML